MEKTPVAIDQTPSIPHSNDSHNTAVDPDTTNEFTPSRLRAYLTLFGATLAFFSTVGFQNAFGVFQAYYELEALSSYSAFQISWIGSVTTFLLFLGAAPSGMLNDRFGPRLPMVIGSVLQVLGLFMLSICKPGQYYQFMLAQGILLALGMGLVFVPPMSAVAIAFRHNTGLGIGISVAGSSVGGVIWPTVINKLLNYDGVDFGWTIRACAFIMLGTLAISCLTVPLSAPPRKSKAEREAESAAAAAATGSASSKKKSVPKRELLKRPAVLMLFASLAVAYFGLFTPFFFVSTYALTNGVATGLAFYTVSVLNAASFFGRIGGGLAADYFGPFNLTTLAIVSSALIIYTWTAATSAAGIIVWAASYGFTSGAIMSLAGACAAQLSTPESYGTVIGMALGASALTGLFGTPISGQLVTYGYLALSMYAGSAMLVGGMFVIGSRFLQEKRLFAKV